MLGHVYVVEDAKDLAQIVRDVTRYGGAYRPEVGFIKLLVRLLIFILFSFAIRMYMSLFRGGQTGKKLRKLLIKLCIISVLKKIVLLLSLIYTCVLIIGLQELEHCLSSLSHYDIHHFYHIGESVLVYTVE